jgi:high-affinity iron transporter
LLKLGLVKPTLRAVLVVVVLLAVSTAAQADSGPWHRLIGILQYLEADYPGAVESQSAFELAEQRSFISEAIDAAAELGPAGTPFAARLRQLQTRIEQSADPQGVSRDCGQLVEELVVAGGLSRSPRSPPDLEKGEALFGTHCAACHGAKGDGQVEIAATMNPPPANFLNPEVADGLTAYKAYNTTGFGVVGTGMPSFAGVLTEDERWALAFFVLTLPQPPCRGEPAPASLEQRATLTNPQLAKVFGDDAVACLRRKVPPIDSERALLAARASVERALEKTAAGDLTGARQALLDGYLDGFEPLEPLLSSRDPKLVQQIEQRFLAGRIAAERGHSGAVADEGRALLALLDQARSSSAGKFWTVFLTALGILLREGFEALVVITALLAVLKKMKAEAQARVVHAGWISAVFAGALAFALARQLIGGAEREWIEGTLALAAVAMLLYAALWLNARSNMRKFMGELRGKMQGALGSGSSLGLFVVAFSAMLRESLETALFLQGLAIDSGSGAALGALAGSVLMLGFAVAVNQVGYKLPMKTLFNVSTGVLVATAVMLLGKGIHALQEAGVFPLHPIAMVRFDLLGIFPDAYSFFPQVALALAPLVWLAVRRFREPVLPRPPEPAKE